MTFEPLPESHHFYHIYADGSWQEPVEEHILALKTSDLDAQKGFSLSIGLVGREHNAGAARSFLTAKSITSLEIGWSREGWEQVTLSALASESRTSDGLAFYAHTKGASTPSRFNAAWRRRMTDLTVVRWQDAVLCLRTDHAYG